MLGLGVEGFEGLWVRILGVLGFMGFRCISVVFKGDWVWSLRLGSLVV